MKISNACAVKDIKYRLEREFITGRPLGYRTKDAWRVQISIGRRLFRTVETYANEASARKAAAALRTTGD